MWSPDETIVALASPREHGLRSIVRVSGPDAGAVLQQVFVGDDPDWRQSPSARRWTGAVRLGPPLGTVGCSLLFWPGPRSYTRQPCGELQLPGCGPLADACIDALAGNGARLARPGEFTMRAFLAGRIDLTQAEAVLGVIDARSQSELNVALRQLSGNLARPLQAARQGLLLCLADVEAGLDFVDEDIEFISADQLLTSLGRSLRQVDQLLSQIGRRGQGDGPPRVVLYGRPNSGKSSLFNRLCGNARALVSQQAGTTRDYLSAQVRLGDQLCELIDTAGLDPRLSVAADEQAQQLGREQLEHAQLKLLCVDVSAADDAWAAAELARPDSRRLTVWTKCDLAAAPAGALSTSSASGAGLESLVAQVVRQLSSADGELEVAPATAVRSRDSLRRAQQSIKRALQQVSSAAGDELVATELRRALDELGMVAGAVHHEELLDQVFSRFCIGK